MGGCSVVVLMMVMMPFFCVYGLIAMTIYALGAWLTGPAFPFCVVGVICDIACLALLVRIAWRKYRERDAFALTREGFAWPLVLFAVGALAFVVMTALTGLQVFGWWREINAEMLEESASVILCR